MKSTLKTIKQLGKGGQGVVILVKDTITEEYFALKKMYCTSIEELNLSLQEAQNVLKMKHEFIVKCHGFTLEKDKETYVLSISYEYCENGSLQDVIKQFRSKNKPIPKEKILKWLKQILLGIMHCHENNIIHRDLKPGNIFLSSNNVKIGDFGFSKDLQGNKFTESLLGSPNYLAPEIKNQQNYNHKIDIWGIAVILADLLLHQTTDFAFSYGTNPEKLLSEVEKRYDLEMSNLLKYVLVVDPEKRNSIVDILNYIQNIKCEEQIYEEILKPQNDSKELIKLQTLVEELRAELDRKDEELYFLKKKKDDSGSDITGIDNSSKNSIFDLFSKKDSKKDSTRMINWKDISMIPKDQIDGAIFTIKFGKWKSKDFGEIDVVLKYPTTKISNLSEFKERTKYNDTVNYIHSNIERIYGITEYEKNSYALVSESIELGPLHNILLNLNISLSFVQKVKIMTGVANALMYIHNRENPLVYLTLKPRSICLDKSKNAKLTTTNFIVPEQKSETRVSVTLPFPYGPSMVDIITTKLNIYSFGFVMWNVFTRKLYEGKDLSMVFKDEENKGKWRPEIPETENSLELEYFEIMKDCWNSDPSLRPTAKNLVFRLEKLLEKIKNKI